jgi:hypothetical protein
VTPDVFERKISDLELARRFMALGLGGFVLKSHYTMTAERASVVRTVTGADVIGSITLNWGVGGLNPVAVEICARLGGRFVWMPTFDSRNEALSANNSNPTGRPPAWLALKIEWERQGISGQPINLLEPDGRLQPAARTILKVISMHDMVLCTGHLSRDEVFALTDAAVEEGVRRIVITHPEFPSQSFNREDQRSLAERGCFLERCFGTPLAGRVPWDVMFDNIRYAGIESSFISSDLGQTHNPPVEDGMALMVDRLLTAGFSESDIRTMAVTNPRLIAGAG